MNITDLVGQLNDTYAEVNSDLERLSSWADQWLVTYNPTKTVSLHITNRKVTAPHPPLSLNGVGIKEINSHCHLGVDLEKSFSWLTHILRIAGKSAKCVGLMRRASRDLPRQCLENLYLTMVRPILEYGGLLFDGSPVKHLQHLDKVQREAALVCTGAYKHTKTTELMNELGWDSLESRRESQKLCLMYKIQSNLAPTYLIDSCPPLVGEVCHYNLRNSNDISLPMGKKTGYVGSFMPSAIRAWNALEPTIKNRNSLDSFKYNLKKAKSKKKTKLYSNFNGSRAINHTRMRMGLSGLKAQRHSYNHVTHPTCDYCGAKKEDAMHYFFQCNTFNNARVPLLEGIKHLYQTKNINLDLTRTLVKKELTSNMLRGDVRFDERLNTELFMMVQDYIYSSKRF
jgi:hypothetical protein